ncbi:MAG TPA: CPBP family intramembrane glutamic endopeptidase [Thermoanaerobaculia bacterium]|nr:CPBP family intramembrane glutamic endopeptidase [Thermoanaerobaculia bacterium]
MNERLTRRDWTLIGVCCGVVALSLFIIFNWFYAAFPEASIDFRYNRDSSLPIARMVIEAQRIDIRDYKHAAVFDGDEIAKIFLERTLGLSNANRIMRREVRIWWWRHRWFRPLQEEEFLIDVAPTGEIVSFLDRIPEDRALPAIDPIAARRAAEAFLARIGVKLPDLQLVAQSERALPNRVQRIFTWDSQSIHPAGAPYRHTITVDGDRVSKYEQRVRVPDQWQRDYHEMRSKNLLAGQVDSVLFIITMVAAVVIFITRLLRGDVHVRLLIGIAIASLILVGGTTLNSLPIAIAGYDTNTSYAAFLTRFVILNVIGGGIGVAMLLAVSVGSGEVLYRERLPQHLAIPKLWQRKALASRRVFLSFVIGYALVAFFLAYQVAFYLIAEKFGAWSPAEVPYDEMLNTAFPWIAVLFAGFFPSLSEEFISRAFSIPFFERIFRNRIVSIIIAGFIWGFGHATYPNQPFFIRGLEVGLGGVLLGFLLFRFGLLPLLIWHYTVDALYTALLLFRSGNAYYVVSAGVASLGFAIPMLISIALYIRNRGFVPDDDLSNASIPIQPAPQRALREAQPIAYPPAQPVTQRRLLVCVGVVAIAIVLAFARPASVDDVVDYRIAGEQAKQIAAPYRIGAKTVAAPVEGFRSWDSGSGREDGGGPDGFDSVAVDYLFHHGMPIAKIADVMKTKVTAATWMVRSFTPQQKDETFTEVDPRQSRVVGYHKYQDEKRAGAHLDQNQGLAIAQNAFRQFGADNSKLDLKEALSFQQPNRRDWLFHFQDRTPLTAEGYRRVSVRVAGDQVTQFASTIKIPEQAYRDEAKTTLLNVVLLVLLIAGILGLLALTVAGFVLAARKHFPWRRPARLTAILAIIPIANAVLRWKSSIFFYNTAEAWGTFVSNRIVAAIAFTGVQIGLLFLALSGMEAAYPQGLDWLRREGRARFGRSALIAAVTAMGLLVIRKMLLQMLAVAFPSIASAGGVDVPQAVNVAWPAVLDIGQAAIFAIEGSAVIALFAIALRGMPRADRFADLTAILAVFFFAVGLKYNTTAAEAPMVLLSSVTGALLIWFVARYVLRENLLAYPLAVALAVLLGDAATLLQNHRGDLIVNAVVDILVAIALIVWMAYPTPAAVGAPLENA